VHVRLNTATTSVSTVPLWCSDSVGQCRRAFAKSVRRVEEAKSAWTIDCNHQACHTHCWQTAVPLPPTTLTRSIATSRLPQPPCWSPSHYRHHLPRQISSRNTNVQVRLVRLLRDVLTGCTELSSRLDTLSSVSSVTAVDSRLALRCRGEVTQFCRESTRFGSLHIRRLYRIDRGFTQFLQGRI